LTGASSPAEDKAPGLHSELFDFDSDVQMVLDEEFARNLQAQFDSGIDDFTSPAIPPTFSSHFLIGQTPATNQCSLQTFGRMLQTSKCSRCSSTLLPDLGELATQVMLMLKAGESRRLLRI
jgi:hypothetical protein